MSKLAYDYEYHAYPDEKYKNLYKQCEEDIDCINKIQTNMMEYIHGQKEKLLRIEDNMSNVNELTEQTNTDLKEISNYTTAYTPIVLGGLIGGITISPLFLIAGVQYGTLISTAGTLFGGLMGYKLQKV
jgi:hypothetical protein